VKYSHNNWYKKWGQATNIPKNSGFAISKQGCVNWIILIYFFSGVCSLVDEVVWVRLFKLTLGNTVYASSIVVSIFMGGLAVGALIMGRYCDRIRAHLRLYAILETLVTISALLLPFLLKLANSMYIRFYRAYHPGHPQLLVVQVIISTAILLVPSMLMGSTLPLLGRFVTALEKETGHLVGRLYALNTLGAAVGCFMAGFVMIKALGVMGTLYTAAILNLLVAAGGYILYHFSKITSETTVEPVKSQTLEAVAARKTDGRFYLLLLAFFLSGLISIGYELLWMRSIVHLLGGFTYIFSAVLTVYLIGNVIGASIGSSVAKKLKNPAAGFAVTLLILGVCGIFYLPVMICWTRRGLVVFNRFIEPLYSTITGVSYTLDPLLQGIVLFMFPALIMGIGFPIALQGCANHFHKVGRSTGIAYGVNTIGAVLGGLATGFLLIPFFGVQLSITILGLLGIWIAAIIWFCFAVNSKKVGRLTFIGIAFFLTILTAAIPSNLFETVVALNPIQQGQLELLAVEEGVTTTVSLHRDYTQEGGLFMCSSGQGIAGESWHLRGDQKALGHFGVLLNKDAKKVLSVGFGSGETTACLAQHNLEQIDCVEIAPEVVKVSLQYFRHLNLGDQLDEKVNMIYMDAKNYMHLTNESYDVIINDSIHPRDFAENASLYTKEYFQTAIERLNKTGLFVSWLPLTAMPESILDSIVGTSMDAFRYVTIWYLTPHPAPLILIVGSQTPQIYSLKNIEAQFKNHRIKKSLAEIHIYNSVDFLSCYVADQDDIKKSIKNFSINSDYSPFVEFSTDPRTPLSGNYRRFVLVPHQGKSVLKHIDWTGLDSEYKQRWIGDYQSLYKASKYLFMLKSADSQLEKMKYGAQGLKAFPRNQAILKAKSDVEQTIFSTVTKMIFKNDLNEAMKTAKDILSVDPKSSVAWIIKSLVMRKKGDISKALIFAKTAVNLAPENEETHLNMGLIFSDAGMFDKAVEEYEKMVALSENSTDYIRVHILKSLFSAYAAAGRISDAVQTADKIIELAIASGQNQLANEIKSQLITLKAQQKP